MENTGDNSNIVDNEILIYQTEDGHTKIDVKLEDETVWLTHAQLCELCQTSKSNISEHINHIFEEGELEENAVVRKFRTTAADGKNYNTIHYTMDDERLKGNGGGSYWNELLDRIRDIRFCRFSCIKRYKHCKELSQ